MKTRIIAVAILCSAFFLTGCETVVVDQGYGYSRPSGYYTATYYGNSARYRDGRYYRGAPRYVESNRYRHSSQSRYRTTNVTKVKKTDVRKKAVYRGSSSRNVKKTARRTNVKVNNQYYRR